MVDRSEIKEINFDNEAECGLITYVHISTQGLGTHDHLESAEADTPHDMKSLFFPGEKKCVGAKYFPGGREER